MIKILIVEDEASIRETLEDHFRYRGDLPRGVETCKEARSALEHERYAIILLDLLLPDGDGLDLLRELRARGDRTPVIVMTALGEEPQRVRGLRLGADDYLVKPVSLVELSARIEAVLRRAGEIPVQVRIGGAEVDLDARQVRRDGKMHHLSHKEAELLAFFLRHPGRTLERTEILRQVWGFDAFPTTRTVDTHVFNLRRKIEDSPDSPCHFLTMHGAGYRFMP